ncbi:uncharacterized protein LOC62_07G009654 [Vanrija pseudolonga]|uniref:Uncharacterized protein n=1 Tax=Vanrija pseudolonga TaxID=143232 RepID=A0AAF0YK50_9TREE|nr:hypothetical protein LOC62_07G009654 [Vanrija pseudolonga]
MPDLSPAAARAIGRTAALLPPPASTPTGHIAAFVLRAALTALIAWIGVGFLRSGGVAPRVHYLNAAGAE